MIYIKDKKDCCGCGACVQRCPKSCITMREDNEGFLYPEIDKNTCIDCGLCEKLCPVINQSEKRKPLIVYAAKHNNEQIRMASSSGGAFSAIAECVIDQGGVVFGAKFNQNWEVVHGYTETKDGLAVFRGSKYVQSKIGESYKEAECFLIAGRKVLFSGTPCQIAGLKRFLRKEYDNLLTIDFICHGVPSPAVWREYLKEEIIRQCCIKRLSISEVKTQIESISFRNKRLGWNKYSFSLALSVTNIGGNKKTVSLSEPLNKNIFLRGFLADLYLRPSCYACPAKSLKSGSDITIGDFWGIQNIIPSFYDNKGVSIIIINKTYDSKFLLMNGKVNLYPYRFDYEKLIKFQPALQNNPSINSNRTNFFISFSKCNKDILTLIDKYTSFPIHKRIKYLLIDFLRTTFLMNLYRRVKYGKK